jgi:hypothetical protein
MSAPIKILIAPRRRTAGNRGSKKTDGWCFPPAVAKLIQKECAGMSILHLFGGKSAFGTRIDVDRLTRPDIIADAWLPPFAENSFDCVVLDPPYDFMAAQTKVSLFIAAGRIARSRVIWFHTVWMSGVLGLQPEKAWLCRPSDCCYVRCLQFFKKTRRIYPQVKVFERGPAVKYNRWLIQPQGLPFPPHPKNEGRHD